MSGVWFIVTIPNKATEHSVSTLNVPLLAGQSNFSEEKAELSSSRTGSVPDSHVVPLCMEDVLGNVLRKLSISDGASWAKTRNGTYHQVLFPVTNEECETVLGLLRDRGFGVKHQSTLSVLPCTLHYDGRETKKEPGDEAKGDEDVADYRDNEDVKVASHVDGASRKIGLETNGAKKGEPKQAGERGGHVAREGQNQEEETGGGGASKVPGGDGGGRGGGVKAKRAKFLQSITSRLTVAQVVEGVRASASLTFDFIMFILLAAMLAAMGLVENSSVTLVASMLVSPMMGPILAGTFGTVIQDKSLQRLGVKNELIALVFCLTFGFVFGLIYGSINNWRSDFWLTTEMSGRSLWVGILIALPSGAGVALSVLGGNAGSLVGVAISASLLPPVVNAGILWAVALTKTVQYQLGEELFFPPNYELSYSKHIPVEVAILGVVSLCLTIVNIICIFIMGVVVLKIKEVAPAQSTVRRFWEKDIRVARDYNKTLGPKDGEALRNQLFSELLREDQEDGMGDDDDAGENTRDDRDTVSEAGETNLRNRRTIRHWRHYMEHMQDDLVYRTVCRASAYPAPKLDVMFASPKGVTWGSNVETSGTTPTPSSANLRPALRRSMSHETPASCPSGKNPGSLPEAASSRWRKRRFTAGAHPTTEFSPLTTFPAAGDGDLSIDLPDKAHATPTSPSGTPHNRRFTWNFHLPRPFTSRFVVTRARDDPLRVSGNKPRHHHDHNGEDTV